jgi:DNA-binding transcriptional LysR family regulator
MLLNLNRIELFVTVAKHHNLGKTAREMHVSASSVCQRLKSLENDFGVKLYKKNREGIELTGAGHHPSFHPSTIPIFIMLERGD